MPYLIDSDIIIDHLAEVPEVNQLLESLVEEGIAMSVVTFMEVYQGVLRVASGRGAQAILDALAESLPVIPFSEAEGRRCAELRETLRRQGKRVTSRALDLLIAATALQHDLTLMTRNGEDYSDLPGLKIHQPRPDAG